MFVFFFFFFFVKQPSLEACQMHKNKLFSCLQQKAQDEIGPRVSKQISLNSVIRPLTTHAGQQVVTLAQPEPLHHKNMPI